MTGLDSSTHEQPKDDAQGAHLSNQQDASLKLSHEAMLLTSDNNIALPSTAMGRVGLTASEALRPGNLLSGVGNAILDDYHHPLQVAEMLGSSALLGAALKTALPESGPAGLIAGAAIGGYFLYQSARPFGHAISEAASATTMDQIHNAAQTMDNTAGSLAVNSVISMGAYKVGAAGANHVLLGERFDGFADAKANFWNGVNDKLGNLLGGSADATAASMSIAKAGGDMKSRLVQLDGTERSLSPRAVDVGDAVGEQPMDITIYAKSKASDLTMNRALQRVLTGRSDYTTDSAYNAKFGADSQAMDAISQFAQDSGLHASDVDPRSGRVVLSGTVDQMGQAFDIQLKHFQVKGPDGNPIDFQAFQGKISVPQYLSDKLDGIYGLDTPIISGPKMSRLIPISDSQFADGIAGRAPGDMSDLASKVESSTSEFMRRGKHGGGHGGGRGGSRGGSRGGGRGGSSDASGDAAGDGSADGSGAGAPEKKPVFYTPRQVADMYNFPKTTGKGQSVAILEFGGGLDPADNSLYYKAIKQPEPTINTILVNGAEGKAGVQIPQDGEVALDSQVIGAIVPDTVQNLIFAPNGDRGFIDAVDRATFPQQGELSNKAISISWGGPENAWTPMGMNGLSKAFQKAALKGISTFVASGDDGALNNSPDGSFQVDYPASDPFVTATGGTRLVGEKGVDGKFQLKEETAWNDMADKHGATGGGISQVFTRPPYQQGIDMPPNANGGANAGEAARGVPDISGNADPETGFVIRSGGHFAITGGTSAVAPLYTALTAQLNEGLGKPVGLLNPKLYALAATNPGVFNDVTQGDNGGYKTSKGWDPVTGLGSVNGQNLLDALKADQANAAAARHSTRFSTHRTIGSHRGS